MRKMIKIVPALSLSMRLRVRESLTILDCKLKFNLKGLVPEKQLLVYQVGEGWERLCDFLGKDVPDVAFPHENAGGSDDGIQKKFYKFNVFEQGNKELRWSLIKICMTSVSLVLFGSLAFKKFSLQNFQNHIFK